MLRYWLTTARGLDRVDAFDIREFPERGDADMRVLLGLLLVLVLTVKADGDRAGLARLLKMRENIPG